MRTFSDDLSEQHCEVLQLDAEDPEALEALE